MSGANYDARFTNKLAADAFVGALIDGFRRMGAIGENATTAQEALHEALDVSNSVFAAMPLPQGDGKIGAAALAAKQTHINLLRTLADFDASSMDSRMSYNRRVSLATEESMRARSRLVVAADEVKRRTSGQSRQTNEQSSRDIVEFITTIFGNDTEESRRNNVDIVGAARSFESLDTLVTRVTERYSVIASSMNVTRNASRDDTEQQQRREKLIVVEPLIDTNTVGSSLIDARLDKRAGKFAQDNLQDEVRRLLAPNRGRSFGGGGGGGGELFPTALTAAAHRLRCHGQFMPTVMSGVKLLANTGEDLVEVERRYRESAGTFRRVLRAAWELAGDLRSFPATLYEDRETIRRRRRHITMKNRKQQLEERLAALKVAAKELTEAQIVQMVENELMEDITRSRRYFTWYEDQLRSIVEADLTANILRDILTTRSSGADARRLFITAYETQTTRELERLAIRLLLVDVEVVGKPPVGVMWTRKEKLAAAHAEVSDRLYESNETLAVRLARNPALEGVLVMFDKKSGYTSIEVDPSAPPDVLPLPATGQTVRTDQLKNVAETAKRVATPGLNVLADPALDDGDVWRIGFKGRLGPALVEMYFACRDAALVSDADKIARLPLLNAYVKSVGEINRVSARGFTAPNETSYDASDRTFAGLVDQEMQKVVHMSLDALTLKLMLFSVENDVERATALAKERTPRVLARVPITEGVGSLQRQALNAIYYIVRLMRREALDVVFQMGDALSITNHIETRDSSLGLITIQVANDTQLTDVQRDRALASIDRSSELILRGVNRVLVSTDTGALREQQSAADDLAMLNRTAVAIDVMFKSYIIQPLGFGGTLLSGQSGAGNNSTSNSGNRLVYVGHRVPASFIDPAFGDLYADIEYRAATSDQSVANEAAIERILASTDTRMLRTITRYDVPVNTGAGGRTRELYVDDVFRYSRAVDAQRLQIVDVFDRSSVTLTLRDPVTNRVEARLLDRVIFGRPVGNETDAQQIIDTLRGEVNASAAGQPLLVLVATLFVRARYSATRPSAFDNLPAGESDEAGEDETILRRLLAMPARGYRAFNSLLDVLEAFRHERNFASQAMLALSIAYANLNFLVLLFGVAQALWPSVAFVLRSIGLVDALARTFVDACITAARKIGVGMSWTLVGDLLGIFEKMSRRHPRAGAAKREAALLRHYMREMTSAGRSLTPLSAIPSSREGELFIDRLYRFINTYGTSQRRALARRTFQSMLNALFRPLYFLLEKIPQMISGTLGMIGWVIAGESVSPSPFSALVLGSLNVFSMGLLAYTLPRFNDIARSFFYVFALNIVTHHAWALTFEAVFAASPQPTADDGAQRSSILRNLVRAGRFGLTALSIIGPDLLSYLSGREYLVSDILQSLPTRLIGGAILNRLANYNPLPDVPTLDITSASGVSRFIDTPTQVVNAYTSFAGRLAGRTFWSMARAYFALRAQDRLNTAAAIAASNENANGARERIVVPDEDLPWMDELDRNETLNSRASRQALARAFFGRPGESDIWQTLLTQTLVTKEDEEQISIDIDSDFIGPATRNNVYRLQRPQAFLVARNFLFLISRMPVTEPLFASLTFARVLLVIEFVGTSVEEAQQRFQREVAVRREYVTSLEAGILSEARGEQLKFDNDGAPAVERVKDDDGQPTGAYRAWQVAHFDTVRLRELGVIVDQLTNLSGVRLIDCELHTRSKFVEDSRRQIVDDVLTYIEARTQATFIELLQDVDIDELGAEVILLANK